MCYNTFHFFLASNSPRGFYSKMDQLTKKTKCNVIKGGPGCGKSTFMTKIFNHMYNKTDIELIHCSSDPNSLDAVILKNKNICFVDGTSPHVLDPDFPGISGNIIDLCKFKDFSHKYEIQIRDLNNQYKKMQYRSQKYLMSFGAIFSDTLEDVIEKINFEKIEKLALSIEKKIFNRKLPKKSNEQTRFLRSIGPEGISEFLVNFKNLNKVYEINDDFFIVTDILLNHIKKNALKYGYDIISCVSPLTLNERLEALMIPELKVGFFLSNNFEVNNSKLKTKKIDILDCYESQVIQSKYNLKMEKSLIQESIKCMKMAKKIHDKMEKIYKDIVDFDSINQLTNSFINKLDKI